MELIHNILVLALSAVSLVNAIIAWWKAIKNKNAAALEKAEADLLANAKVFIADAESTFEGFDKMMKSQNSSAGAMKKDTVLTKLQAYALQNGYTFDVEKWAAKIDELVAFTKAVNTKK